MFPTNEYKHRSDLLWYQYQSEALDYDSYMIALTRLVQEEKGRYEWYQYHKAKEAAWEYERQREERLNQASRIEAEQEAAAAVKKAEAERLAKLSPQERYWDKEWSTVSKYRNDARYYRTWHNWLQAIIIIGSILVTGLVGLELPKWIPLFLSIMVSLAAGFTGYYKYKERSINLQQAADAIEREFKAADLGIREYKDKKTPQERLLLLSERVEWLKEEQQKRALQLEQPPEAKILPK